MKILFILNTLPTLESASTGIFNYRCVKAIAQECEVDVVHVRAWFPGRPFTRKIDLDGISVTQLFLPFSDNFHPIVTSTILSFLQFFSDFMIKDKVKNCDVIHSVGVSLSGILSGYLAKKYQKRHIAQCIGSDVNIDLPRIVNLKRNWLKGVSCFGCNSLALDKKIKALYPFKESHVIYRGIDVNRFSPEIKMEENQKVTFLFIGGYCDRGANSFGRDLKGGVTLLKSISKLLENGVEDFQVNLAGPCSSQFNESPEFDRIQQVVEVIGMIRPEEMVSRLNNADVMIVPSRLEGLPNAAVEALSCGRPVIGSRTGGVPEVIENGENGFLFEPGNSDELYSYMLRFINDRSLINDMGKKSRQTVLQKFRDSDFSSKYMELYSNQ